MNILNKFIRNFRQEEFLTKVVNFLQLNPGFARFFCEKMESYNEYCENKYGKFGANADYIEDFLACLYSTFFAFDNIMTRHKGEELYLSRKQFELYYENQVRDFYIELESLEPDDRSLFLDDVSQKIFPFDNEDENERFWREIGRNYGVGGSSRGQNVFEKTYDLYSGEKEGSFDINQEDWILAFLYGAVAAHKERNERIFRKMDQHQYEEYRINKTIYVYQGIKEHMDDSDRKRMWKDAEKAYKNFPKDLRLIWTEAQITLGR